MTVEEIRGEIENYDKFPVGLRVLAVDDDPTCLKLLETLLRKCKYLVTITGQTRTALKMLRENRESFDLVISDVHMPDMDGFKLLEFVGLEIDLPLIMLSANSDPKLVMKGVTHGACDYLVKPIRVEELRNIWQHVIRRKKFDPKKQTSSGHHNWGNAHQENEGHSPSVGNNVPCNRKRKDEEEEEEEGSEDDENNSEDPATQKKPRVVWSIELHRNFVAAVNQLGLEEAAPKRILDMMGVNGLTRENVARHLQKYRLYLKRVSSVAAKRRANMAAVLGEYRSLSSPGSLGNVSVSPFAANTILRRLNSPSSSIPSLGKIHPTGQNPNLFHGMPPSVLGENSKPGAFGDVGSGNLLNGTPINLEFANQPPQNVASFVSDPPFDALGPPIRYLKNNDNHSSSSNNRNELSSAMHLVGGNITKQEMRGEQRQCFARGLNDAFGGPSSNIPGNGNITSVDMFVSGRSNVNASTFVRENKNADSSSRERSNEDYVYEQRKLQGGFGPRDYDPLDEMVNAYMIKREHEEDNLPNCEFGFDDHSSVSGI